MTRRRFFAYFCAVINYADCAPARSIAYFYGNTTGHANASVQEAWFSDTRNLEQKSATRYQLVANSDMKKANADQSLAWKKMHSSCDVGELSL